MTTRESLASALWLRCAVLIATALALCGCNNLGTRALSGGRGAYAEVINKTEDEQLLSIIVRHRYDETFGMISVASITANLRFRAEIGANTGVGDSSDVAGNLVPLSAGMAYEENPTISYVPLSGEDFMQRMLKPVPIGEWLLAGGAVRERSYAFALAVRRLNGLRNRLIGDRPPSPQLARFLQLYQRLRVAGVIDIVAGAEGGPALEQGEYYWDFESYGEEYREDVRELLDIVGIEIEVDGSPFLVPFRMALGSSPSAANVLTRSTLEVFHVFGAGIEVPQEHLEAGIVEPVSFAARESPRFITIRTTDGGWWDSRPEHASVAIRFRDRWFYVDSTDTKSKRAFRFLRTLVGIRLADPTRGAQAPVITVPVN